MLRKNWSKEKSRASNPVYSFCNARISRFKSHRPREFSRCLEVNPVLNKLKELSERTELLRGHCFDS